MSKSYYFICLSFWLIATEIARCTADYGFHMDAGGWLKVYMIPATWEEAYLKCHSDGAVLASPLNKDLANALHTQISHYREDSRIYIGIHDLYSKGHFVSVEGMPLSDMKVTWGPNGNAPDAGDCLTMSVDGSVYYSSCNDPLPYICYRKLDDRTMNECGTFDNEYHLNQRTGSCYKVHGEKLIWSHAYGICASEGAHLVVLDDEEEANVIKTLYPQNVNEYYRFHVGFGSWGTERIWTTIDGRRLEDVYHNWTPGQPDNKGGNQDRGALLKNGYLDDVGTEKLQFVCEKSPKSKRFEDLPPCMAVLKNLCKA